MADETIDDIHKHTVPYAFREFPKHVHKPAGQFLAVNSAEEEAAALKAGWRKRPYVEGEKADKAEKDKAE
jgi:hypothetical protein